MNNESPVYQFFTGLFTYLIMCGLIVSSGHLLEWIQPDFKSLSDTQIGLYAVFVIVPSILFIIIIDACVTVGIVYVVSMILGKLCCGPKKEIIKNQLINV
jgi:hypothetical protein